MRFKQELLGDYIRIEKGLTYKGEFLGDESDVGLVGMDSFIPGGGYKRGSEKPYDGPFKGQNVAEAGDLILCATDVTQDGSVLSAPLLVPEDLGGFSTLVFSHHVGRVVVERDGLRPEFIYNFLRIPINRLRCAYGDTGTTVRALPFDVVYEQKIPMPSIEEQDRINSFIALLDRKIELNTAMATTLERIAQSLFRSWFVDFDPVKEKMAGEKPTGMDDATATLFPDSMEDSELGQIPKGWEARSLSAIGEFRNGLAMQKFPVVDAAVVLPVIKIAQLRAGHTRGADIASGLIDEKFVITDGDVLFSWSGTLEIEHWTGGPGALNQHLFLVIGKSVPDWFLYFASRVHLPEFRNIASSKATTMGHIQRSHLVEALCAVPKQELINAANQIIMPLIEKKIALHVENRKLAELRDVLLPELITGEIQISEEMMVG